MDAINDLQAQITEGDVAAAIALVLEGFGESQGWDKEQAIKRLLMKLPDPPEPEAASEAARMIVLVDEANGQSSSGV